MAKAMLDTRNEVLHRATDWFVILSSGEDTAQDRQAWKAWLEANPEHQRAWQKIEAVTQQFSGLDSKTSIAVLNRKKSDLASQDRRQMLKSIGLVFVVGSTSWLSYEKKPWNMLMADYSTGIGEIKHVTLEDGTKLVLNTNAKVAVHFNDDVRNIELLQGEVYIETAQEKARNYRPFRVTTEHGTIIALGTRFSVRLDSKHSSVSVYQDAVEVHPVDALGDKVVVNTGELVTFSAALFQQKRKIDLSSMSWTKGFLIADKMPLVDFIKELSRYNSGILRCDPAIADLEISGAFPLNDTNATLKSISQVLSIRIESFTRYWTVIKPA